MLTWSVADVMTTRVVSVRPAAGCQEIAELLMTHRISAVPVVDPAGAVLGVVSQADLLERLEYADTRPNHPLMERALTSRNRRATGDTAAALMSAPAVTITADAPVAAAARLMTAARVKRLPVVDGAGVLAGIVSRHDLLRLFARPDGEIRESVVRALVSLGLHVGRLRVEVNRGQVFIAGPVLDDEIVRALLTVVGAIPGVVDVLDDLHRPVALG